jgi:hypothetical protein
MSVLGRHARVRSERDAVWDIIRKDPLTSSVPFTAKEFCKVHASELKATLKSFLIDGSLEGTVRGVLQSLANKGLLQTRRGADGLMYGINMYLPEKSMLQYNYGRAMIEAQRLHLL